MFFMLRRLHHMTSFFTEILQVGTFLAEVAPHTFLLHQKSTSWHFSHWVHATWLPFLLPNHVARGQGYCLKRNPMCVFALQQGSHMEAPKHIWPPMTQLQHFIPFYSEIFQTCGIHSSFNLPWQHSLMHFIQMIWVFGAPNGLCLSITESKHIRAIKKPYQQSNCYQALGQMLLINQCEDKIVASQVDFQMHGMLKGACLSHSLELVHKLGES